MKKYGVPTNKWEVVVRNLVSAVSCYVANNDIKTLVLAFQKNAASPVLASLLKAVCESQQINIIFLSLLKNEEKLPEEILNLYNDNILALSGKERQFYEENYTPEELLEIQFAIARNTTKTYQNALFISDINMTEVKLDTRLICEKDFRPFQNLSGSEIYELADFLGISSDYLDSLDWTDSREYYDALDTTWEEYLSLRSSQELPQINQREIETKIEALEKNNLIRCFKQVKTLSCPSYIPREELFKYGNQRLD